MTLVQSLGQFTGTENWFRHGLVREHLYTDGVRHFAEEAGAYWFVDDTIIEFAPLVNRGEFLSITLTVADSSATIRVEDGDCTVLKTKLIEYTDCPAGEYKFFYCDKVLMLTSEY